MDTRFLRKVAPAPGSGYAASVGKASDKKPISVCLFWVHPLVRSEFERALPEPGFRLETLRLEPKLDVRQVPVPMASLYVVDGAYARVAAEALVSAILARNPAGRVLVVAEAFDESSAFPLLRLGVKGLLTYAEVAERLPAALQEVADGGFWVPRTLLSRFVDSTLSNSPSRALPAAGSLNPSGLTRREQEVLNDLLENFSNKEIAKRLRISERTAKFHVSNVLAKYGVRRRADLILLSFTDTRRGA
jgi:DNA-binding NarL/FixJ family response regulator